MPVLSVNPSYDVFQGLDGQPLEDGYIWIGTANLEPQTNPINVYWDAALTQLAAQPIRTLAGYPSRNGTPANLYVNSDYSLRVMDKNGGMVYSAPAPTERYSGSVIAQIDSSQVTFTPAGTGAATSTVQAKLRQNVSIIDFGAATTNTAAANTTAINAAIQAAESVYIPPGTYPCNTITLRSGVSIYGAGPASVLSFPTGQTGLYGLSSGAGSYLESISLSNFKLLGAVAASGFSEFIHLLQINGARNLFISNMQFVGFQGDGVYLGANTDNTRHNLNVSITNCLFDGVNKDNRNAISVIDCDNLLIRNNIFQNASRSNMPGFIDVEPNNDANVVRKIQVTGNSFENTDCAEAAVGIIIVNPTLTVAPETFIITNNTFNINKRMVSFRVAATYTPKHNLVVSGNTGVVSSFGDYYPKINGAAISNNTLTVTTFAVIGLNNTDTINNLSITGNTFNGGGTANRAFSLRCGSGHSITGNVFSNFATYGFLCGISGGTLSNTTITGNTFVSTGTYSVGSAGGIDGVSCMYMNNTSTVTHQFPAWRTDDTGNITNGDTSPTTFNADNLPGEFTRQGIYRSAINGDTAVPSTGGYQGTLETHCEVGNNGRKWKYQVYWPANNTVKINSFYLRKANGASDVWESWAEVAGV